MARSESVFDAGVPGADPETRAEPDGTDFAPEVELENRLRPPSFAEFVGQPRAVDNLRIAIQAALTRGEPPDHVLLSGPPGLGKTSLSRILAYELGTKLHTTTGPALERARDLVGILTKLRRGDVLFIDEVHRVQPTVEEYLYSAMEDYRVDLTLDQGAHARIVTLKLQQFTLIGATTREGLLSAPFRGRFGLFERLVPYPPSDLAEIVLRSAHILEVAIDPEAAAWLAERSRGTPRIANRFLRRARDLALVRGEGRITTELAIAALTRLGIDERGLEEMDRRILRFLAQCGGEPVGLKTISAGVDEPEGTIEEVFEPHLLRAGLLQRTSRGRVLTPAGFHAIGLEPGGPAGAGQLFD